MDIFTLVGKLTLEGTAKAERELGDLQKRTEKVQKGLKVMGAAFTAVGVAGLALIQTTKKMNAQLGVTALNLGITTKEMRSLALETTNVTFPLDEVLASFDLLARAGVKDAQVLKDTATAFDTLGDAIGLSASQVTQAMVPAMKTFGLTAEEMAKKTDIMTFMSRESTMTMADFNTMVGYTTPELVAAGLTMDDLTIALIHMERQGYAPGRVMTREFMKATTAATKEQIPLTEALGITTEELASYKKELAGATGMTQKYADVANEQYTLMDKLKQKFSEITLGMSGFLEPLEPILLGMTALGPIMLIVATNTKLATIATRLFGIAWKIASGPIGWAIAAVGLLVGAGIALWKNWDTVKIKIGEAIEGIVHSVGWLGDKILGYVGKIVDSIAQVMYSLAKFVNFLDHDVAVKIHQAANKMKESFYEFHKSSVENLEGFESSLTQAAETTVDASEVIGDASKGMADKQGKAFNRMTSKVKKYITSLQALAKATGGSLAKASEKLYGPAWAEREGPERTTAMLQYMAETGRAGTTEYKELQALGGYQHGGLIPEPTLLYGLKSKRPYGIAGEAGREWITPESGSRPTIINNIYLDGELISRNTLNRLTREVGLEGGL